jgi:hypothetical protein
MGGSATQPLPFLDQPAGLTAHQAHAGGGGLLILLVATSSPGEYVAGSHARPARSSHDWRLLSLGFLFYSSRDDPRA